MRAAVYIGKGAVQVRDVEKPIPADNEVLVRIHATTICAADYRIKGSPRVLSLMIGLRKGKIFGMELSGTVDSVGKAGYSRCLKTLKRGGPLVLITISGGLPSILGDLVRQQWISITGAAKIVGGLPRIAPGDLALLRSLIEAGELKTTIDRRYSLDDIAEAFRYAEAGHKKGHVVINVVPSRNET